MNYTLVDKDNVEIRKRRIAFFGHMLRMGPIRLTNRIFTYCPDTRNKGSCRWRTKEGIIDEDDTSHSMTCLRKTRSKPSLNKEKENTENECKKTRQQFSEQGRGRNSSNDVVRTGKKSRGF